MERYFSDRGRKYTKTEVLAGEYTLTEGDYVRFQWSNGGQHSALFIKYIDDASNPTDNTRFQTIEGNAGSTGAFWHMRIVLLSTYRAIGQRTGIQTYGNGAERFPGFRVEYRQADLDLPGQCGFVESQLVDV